MQASLSRIAIAVVAAGFVAGSSRVASAQTTRTWPAADSVPPHETFTVESKALGESRRINVYTPPAYRTSREAFPVLYMPDGGLDEDFPHLVNTVDSLIVVGAIRPIIVVGIPNTQRRRDLTGPTRVASDSAIASHVGGSAAFRKFLRDELIPEVTRRYRTTPERGIIGESLAGLFVVETFLLEHDLFAHSIALDPSVWWNAGAMIDSAQAHIARFDAAPHTLYVATSNEPSTAIGAARLTEMLRTAKTPNLRVTYEPRTDLTHANIFRTVKPKALVDAFHVR